jgi:hypothetical protein
MTSSTYDLFARAIREKKQVLCRYHGAAREICPIMLGHSKGAERALAWQFAGSNEKGEPVRGAWKCLALDDVSDVLLRDGPWHAGASHQQRQTCLDSVDLDVNPDSPYRPRLRLVSSR